MGTRVSLQTSLKINSLCFNSGKIFNIIFLVEKTSIAALDRASTNNCFFASEWLLFFPRQRNR